MGANQAQTLKVLREAEAYDGPSLILAYAPCINHGIKAGMGLTQEEERKAVECGYWHLWRFDPRLAEEGKNPFILDSKEPKWELFKSFLKGETRYEALYKQFPAEADELAQCAEDSAKHRYNTYKRMANMVWDENL
jgi:pyruvate-ferredoxin/flavodoxin oxidoreductase